MSEITQLRGFSSFWSANQLDASTLGRRKAKKQVLRTRTPIQSPDGASELSEVHHASRGADACDPDWQVKGCGTGSGRGPGFLPVASPGDRKVLNENKLRGCDKLQAGQTGTKDGRHKTEANVRGTPSLREQSPPPPPGPSPSTRPLPLSFRRPLGDVNTRCIARSGCWEKNSCTLHQVVHL